jgi:hypothetical protein
MKTVGKILWAILKILFKIFLILLWGCCRIAELILKQVNEFLNYIITKRHNTQHK